ncbi:hypothetical protein BZM27_54935, partial [Paraburkholderia steynii]
MRHVAFGLLPLTLAVPSAFAQTRSVADAPAAASSTASTGTQPADTELPAVSITASSAGSSYRPVVDPNLPATTETVTREQLESRNVVNTEDALKYLP